MSEPATQKIAPPPVELSTADALYVEIRPKILRLLAERRLPPDRIEDIVHDAFDGYLRAGPDVQDPEAWLLSEAVRRADGPPSFREGDAYRRADEALWALSERERAIVRLREREGIGFDDIAARLEIEPDMARELYDRACEQMEERLFRFFSSQVASGAFPKPENRSETLETLGRLPGPYRQALEARYVSGLDPDQAALSLAMTPEAFRERLRRGEELLERATGLRSPEEVARSLAKES